MEETLRQLGGLLLGAVPTVILLLVLFAIYTILVHRPLVRVLAERHSKTEGAVEQARADISAAEARTAEYEQKLRSARLAIFRAQEARRQAALQARATLVAQARSQAQTELEAARSAIERDKEAAQVTLQSEAASLAAAIIRTVLQPSITQSQAGGSR